VAGRASFFLMRCLGHERSGPPPTHNLYPHKEFRMIGFVKALGVVKTAAAIAAISAAAVVTTQMALPAAANLGQAHASAGAANASPATTPATGKDVTAITARLDANQARLLATLEGVLARLEANPDVNAKAIAAVKAAIERIESGDVGLSRAAQAVASAGPPASPAPSHPSATDHPSASSHPGQP
jgi:hypothetical protein